MTMKKNKKIIIPLLLVVASSLLGGCVGGAKTYSKIYKKTLDDLVRVELLEWRSSLPVDVITYDSPWFDSAKNFFEHINHTLYKQYATGGFSYIDVKFTYRLYFKDDKTKYYVHCMSDDRLIARTQDFDKPQYISLLPIGGAPDFTLD